jgi:TetR/AcrR family transcriptional regulator, regulator of mycofactocin system
MDVPTRKRDATRQRLLDAANRRFLTHGYDGTTASAIAEDAGVTERTFFRYFPTKADVLVANWREHAAAGLGVLLADRRNSNLADAVRDALILFTGRLETEFGTGLNSVIRLYSDRAAYLAVIEVLLEIENRLADEIARHAGQASNDFAVRTAANAAVGVFRAAIRATVVDPSGPPISELITVGMRRLRSCFNALTAE